MRFPQQVVIGWTLLIGIAAAVVVAHFRIDNSVSVWFDQADPALITYARMLEEFGPREWVLVGAERHKDAPDAAFARDIARLARRFRELPDVHVVLAAADFPAESPFVWRFLRPDSSGRSEGLLVQVTNELHRQDSYREALVDGMRAAAMGLPALGAVRVAGIAVINAELNRAARRDMFRFFPLVVLLLALLGALLFHSLRDVAVLLSVALGTVILTAGALVAAGHPLNMVTIMLPTVLIALSVADAVHLIEVFHQMHAADASSAHAAASAVRAIAGPCAGTTLTTIAGFLSFAGSDVLPIFQLAIFGSLGIALAWVLTMTLGAGLLTLFWRQQRRPHAIVLRAGRGAVGALHAAAARHPWLIAMSFGIAGCTLAGLHSLRADTDYVRFFHHDAVVPREYRALDAAGFPQNPLALIVEFPAEADAGVRYGSAVAAFAGRLESLPEVSAVLSPFTLPGTPEQARALGLVSADGRRVQLLAMMDYPSSRSLLASLRTIRALADTMLPSAVQLIPTGTSLLWAHMDEGVIRTQRQSLLVVTVVCLLVLALLFRSLWLAVVGVAVSLYPVAMVLGLMGLLDIPLNMATVLIAGVAVGLAVDDTIHFVHGWQALRAAGRDPATACREAMADMGVRTTMTSLIVVGSFIVLGYSDFMPTAHFGLLSSLTVALALAADLLLLPMLLSLGHAQPRSSSDAALLAAAAGGSCE